MIVVSDSSTTCRDSRSSPLFWARREVNCGSATTVRLALADLYVSLPDIVEDYTSAPFTVREARDFDLLVLSILRRLREPAEYKLQYQETPELEREIVVRMRPRDCLWINAEVEYLGHAKPRVVLDLAPAEIA
jgi:hypothetical protein